MYLTVSQRAFLCIISDPHYPFAELFMCLGFFLIYGIEVTVHTFLSGSHGEGVVHGHRLDNQPNQMRFG